MRFPPRRASAALPRPPQGRAEQAWEQEERGGRRKDHRGGTWEGVAASGAGGAQGGQPRGPLAPLVPVDVPEAPARRVRRRRRSPAARGEGLDLLVGHLHRPQHGLERVPRRRLPLLPRPGPQDLGGQGAAEVGAAPAVRQRPSTQPAAALRTAASPVSAHPPCDSLSRNSAGSCPPEEASAFSHGYRNPDILPSRSAPHTTAWYSLSTHRFRITDSTSGRRSRSPSSASSDATPPGPLSPPATMALPSGRAHTLPITLPRHCTGSPHPSSEGGRAFATYEASRKRSRPSSAASASCAAVAVVMLASSMACQWDRPADPSSHPDRSASAQRRGAPRDTSSSRTAGTAERLTSACSAAFPPAMVSASCSSAFFCLRGPPQTSSRSSSGPAAAALASALSASLSSGLATGRGFLAQYSRNSWRSVCASTPSAARRRTSGLASCRNPTRSSRSSSPIGAPRERAGRDPGGRPGAGAGSGA